MITCPWLGRSGRLGNQLWQIASTIGIGDKCDEAVSFPPWVYQPFFSVPDSFFTDEPGTPVNTMVPHIHRAAADYLQDYSLFADIASEIRRLLVPSDFAYQTAEAVMNIDDLPHPVLAIHVRRGDNATAHLRNEQGHHPLRPDSYYVEGAERYRDASSIVVFSDDLPWCNAHLPGLLGRDDLIFFEGGPARPKEHEPEYQTAPILDWIDLVAMTYCDYFVLSNSTYSWWGAFLSGTAGENITYPAPWFGKKLSYIDASLMFPKDWKVLQHAV